jgi:hypothetical protein
MKEIWPLPNDDKLVHNGSEWLISLLHEITEEQKVATLLTFWRIWHAHNEITHDKPCPSIEGSRRFLAGYRDSLMLTRKYSEADIIKGKMVVDHNQNPSCALSSNTGVKETLAWTLPPQGFAKLNVDGAFTVQNAGAGMVLRDHVGDLIFTACRHLDTCMDALEAELAAIEEGIKLALHWSALKIIVETDCADAVELIGGKKANLSAYAFRITIIRELLRERDIVLVKINRSCNSVGHELAKIGRTQARTELWLSSFPPEAAEAIANDCNSAVSS